ncbi:MAG: hypothetical protein KTR33_00845 [Gammaproteobacteria bacterium]|nr:hypothetical protein [Gammaproteobacteria bacterium]
MRCLNVSRRNRNRSCAPLAALLVVLVAITGLFSTRLHAEYTGLLHGRSGDLTKLSDLSVEFGFVTGDFSVPGGGDADYDHLGLRVNYRVSPGIIATFDIGKTDIGTTDGNPFGFGLYYQLQDLISNMDAALRGSFHTGELEAGRAEFDIDVIDIELLVSGREPLGANGLEWYGNVGLQRLKVESESDTELTLGGGLILPVGAGEGFFGIEHAGDITFGVGFRYNI